MRIRLGDGELRAAQRSFLSGTVNGVQGRYLLKMLLGPALCRAFLGMANSINNDKGVHLMRSGHTAGA